VKDSPAILTSRRCLKFEPMKRKCFAGKQLTAHWWEALRWFAPFVLLLLPLFIALCDTYKEFSTTRTITLHPDKNSARVELPASFFVLTLGNLVLARL